MKSIFKAIIFTGITLSFFSSAHATWTEAAENAGQHIIKILEIELEKAYSQENYCNHIDDQYGLFHYVLKIERANFAPANFSIESENQELKAYFDRFKYYIVKYKE